MTIPKSALIPKQNNLKSKFKKLVNNFLSLQSLKQKLKYLQQSTILPQRTRSKSKPNLDPRNLRFLFAAEAINLNIKTFGYEYARNLRNSLDIPQHLSPQKIALESQVCQQKDIESPWFWYWCQVMQIPVNYHRKIWEFAYILQALYNYDLLVPGKKGLGFGCGEEPIPSVLAAYDIKITATDLNLTESAAKGWVETNQSMSSLEKIWYPDLCSRELFEHNVSLEYVDMNNIADSLNNQYDFCWSACALEHLGSIKNGLDFIENSLNTLVPGGVAIHTTELNYLEEEETIDNWATVLFRKKDFQSLADKLTASGHKVVPLNFDIGSGILDRFIDLPPYDSKIHQQEQGHLKLLIDGFASTSFGLIIQKSFKLSKSKSHKSEEQMTKSYSERVVHFIHLPRTGGTSIRRQLVNKIFKSGEVFPAQQYDELGRWDEYYFPEHGPLSISLLNSYKFYSGHFGGWVVERLVEKPVSAFTLLRDPIEQIASFYQYFLQSILEEHQLLIRENPEAFQDLASFVNSPYCPFNQQTRVLGYDPGERFQSLLLDKRTCSSLGGILPPITTDEPLEIFKLAKKRLETCSLVGVTARREQFFQKLEDIYGWQLDPKVNINIVNPKYYKSVSIEPYLRDFIRDRQYWDYKLYELALEISYLR